MSETADELTLEMMQKALETMKSSDSMEVRTDSPYESYSKFLEAHERREREMRRVERLEREKSMRSKWLR